MPPSTINHQPSTINHQPSTINHQPSTINHQPSSALLPSSAQGFSLKNSLNPASTGGTLKSLAPKDFIATPEQLQDFYRRPESFSTQGVNQTLIYPGLVDVESLRLQYDLGPGPWQTYISYVPAQTEDGKNVTHPSNAQALPLLHTVSKSDTFDTFSLWVRAEKLIRGSNNMLFPQELSIGTNVAWKKNQGAISIDVSGYQNHDFISQDGINYSSNASKVSGSYNDVRAEVKDNQIYTYKNNPLPLNCNAYYRMSTYWGEPLASTATVTPIPGDPFHAWVNMDFGYTDNIDPEPSSAQRGSSFCNVKSGVGGSDKVTVKMNITVKMDYTPQYRCEKNGSEWYYDSFAEIPNKFAVSDYTCIPCAADEKRDPNNPGQCVKACAVGLTSTDHGATCQTVPDPTPSANATWRYGLWEKPKAPDGAFGVEVCQEYTTFAGKKQQSCFRCPAGTSHDFGNNGVAIGCKQGSKSDGFTIYGFNSHRLNGNQQCERLDY